METDPNASEEEMLASTLSTCSKTQKPEAVDDFQRVNVLFAPEDLRTIDAKVHDLKTLGLRWVNRSLLVRHAIRGLEQVPADQLARAPAFLQLKK
jgi:hypothetical protein